MQDDLSIFLNAASKKDYRIDFKLSSEEAPVPAPVVVPEPVVVPAPVVVPEPEVIIPEAV